MKHEEFAEAVDGGAREVREMLVAKNRKYGNSALEPVRLFSRANTVEQLKVRIDDKLSRIRTESAEEDEDAVLDLLGYLYLLRIARRYNQEEKA